jgi:glyoxylase-like metal-dependent hydrolase (beta-lactamase superfamily II)
MALAADDDSAITITHLTGPVYKINAVAGFDVNFIASIGRDGILLVDTGFKETAPELARKLKEFDRREVRYIINTHSHVDHTGGNRAFGKTATIIAHPELRNKIRTGRYLVEENPPQVLPDLVFDGELRMFFNGEEIRITAQPGSHDNDDLVVHFTKSKVVYMGDLAYGMHFPSYDTRTGDATKYAAVVAAALDFIPDDVTVVSGHGRDCTVPEMREYQQMLDETTRIVLQQLAEGAKAAEISVDSLGRWGNFGGPYVDGAKWIRNLALSFDRRDAPGIDTIGPMYLARKQGGLAAALRTFDEIRAKHPDDYHLDLYLFGKYLVEQKAWDEAATVFALANEAFPNNPYVWYFWFLQGDVHQSAGNYEAAAREFRESLRLNPENTTARAALDELEILGSE